MRYEILGPLRITDDDSSSFISTHKMEVVLAALLIRADQVVTIDQLIGEIWCDRAPRRAVASVHVYISQLRKLLSRHGQHRGPIVTHSPGYALILGSDELDFHCFRDLVNSGRDQFREGRYEEAVRCLDSALSLWRGPLLNRSRNGPIIEGFTTWLKQAWLESIEMLIESRLMLGRHRELVGELYSLTAEYPLHEAFYRQLMLALYRSERQADALEVYQSARRKLQDELEVEPCRALQEFQQAILIADDQLKFQVTR
jgi:SARP family transcriptional regulator, regulator of embCAB operon